MLVGIVGRLGWVGLGNKLGSLQISPNMFVVGYLNEPRLLNHVVMYLLSLKRFPHSMLVIIALITLDSNIVDLLYLHALLIRLKYEWF